MSLNSSRKRPFKYQHWPQKLLVTAGLSAAFTAWTVGSVFVLGGLLGGLIYTTALYQLGVVFPDAQSSASQTALSVIVYILGLAILLVEPYAVRRYGKRQIMKLFGVLRRPALKDIGYAFIALAGYIIVSMVISVAATILASWLGPWFDMNQQQMIGFEQRSSVSDIVLAFVIIVVAAPVVEELIFRGYLYGSLRPRMPWWLAAAIVSAVFGVVHGQWNVALDVFAMSLVMCYLREKTGTIWSGMIVHILKNFIAFSILFLLPEPLRQLIMGL